MCIFAHSVYLNIFCSCEDKSFCIFHVRNIIMHMVGNDVFLFQMFVNTISKTCVLNSNYYHKLANINILYGTSGDTLSDTAYCIDCKTKLCQPGEYLSNYCSGTSTADTAVCLKCSISKCAAGEYIQGACSGSTTEDTALCVACTVEACLPGFFRPICNGSAHRDAPCLPCSVGSCLLVSLLHMLLTYCLGLHCLGGGNPGFCSCFDKALHVWLQLDDT